MPTTARPHAVLARVGRAALARPNDPDSSDGHVLGRFVATGDEEAFAALVARHGPLVYAVCRRVARDPHLADDAFQAAFLVLARRAADVRPADAVRGWLYGVAVRTAREARTRSDRRRRREAPVPHVPDRPAPEPPAADPDAIRALDEEIARLPDRLRAAVVLCELDGIGRRAAAARLGVPEGTLSSRLASARRVLAERLRARGVAASVGTALGAFFTQAATAAPIPPAVITATARITTAGASAAVTALANGVFRTMLLDTCRRTVIGCLVLAGGLVTAGAWGEASPAATTDRPAPPPTAPGLVQVKPDEVATDRAPSPLEAAPDPRPADPKLNAHLAAWEKASAKIVNYRAAFTLTCREAVFQKGVREYDGVILWMKPHFSILRLDNTEDPTKSDYTAYIRNEKAVYEYSGLQKKVTEIPLPTQERAAVTPPQGPWDRLVGEWLARLTTWDEQLPFTVLTGVTAEGLKQRFHVTLYSEDAHYVYLDIRPRLPKDMQEFQQARFALYGPNVKAPYTPYLPVQAWVLKPNQDTVLWKFTKLETNLPGIDEKAFRHTEVKGFTFKSLAAPRP